MARTQPTEDAFKKPPYTANAGIRKALIDRKSSAATDDVGMDELFKYTSTLPISKLKNRLGSPFEVTRKNVFSPVHGVAGGSIRMESSINN